jgi:toxin ParE1/3/4
MKRSYVVSKGAAADLRDIAKYTFTTWGEQQRRAYIAELEKSAEALAKGEEIFKDMSFVLPSLRMTGCGKHYIFCMPQEGKPSVILAVLHQSMDLMERLKDRLR